MHVGVKPFGLISTRGLSLSFFGLSGTCGPHVFRKPLEILGIFPGKGDFYRGGTQQIQYSPLKRPLGGIKGLGGS